MKVEVLKLDNFGRGITYINNKICFIENALPKEVVEIEMAYNGESANVTLKNNPVKKEVNIPNTESFMNYITDYLKEGLNTITFKPLGDNDFGKTAKVWVEVVK